MIRYIAGKPGGAGVTYFEISGLSTDSKPTENVATGSIFVEVDTGGVFFYDEASEAWIPQFTFQGSEGA